MRRWRWMDGIGLTCGIDRGLGETVEDEAGPELLCRSEATLLDMQGAGEAVSPVLATRQARRNARSVGLRGPPTNR